MAFLVEKPFIIIIIAIICFITIIRFVGVPAPQPPVLITPSLETSSITVNSYTTLAVVIENRDTRVHTVQYRVVGIFSSEQLRFYFKNGTLLPDPLWNGANYSIIYPITLIMDRGNQWGVSLLVKGFDFEGTFVTYRIFVEIWADDVLSDRKSVQLQVNATS